MFFNIYEGFTYLAENISEIKLNYIIVYMSKVRHLRRGLSPMTGGHQKLLADREGGIFTLFLGLQPIFQLTFVFFARFSVNVFG